MGMEISLSSCWRPPRRGLDASRLHSAPGAGVKKAGPGNQDGIQWMDEQVQESKEQKKPQPREPNYAIGSVQWEEKQKKRRAADRARAQAEDEIIAERAAAAEEDRKREAQRAAAAAAEEA
jgi:hypothetical protein